MKCLLGRASIAVGLARAVTKCSTLLAYMAKYNVQKTTLAASLMEGAAEM